MTSEDDFHAQIKVFEEEFRHSLPQKIRDIDAAWARLRNGVTREGLYDILVRLHSLAGSGRTFGVAGLSEAAAAAEGAIEPLHRSEALPGPAELTSIEPLLEAVREAAASPKQS